MAQISPTRPSRRAAQRQRIVDSPDDEDDDVPMKIEPMSDEEHLASPPKRPTRRPSRRQAGAPHEADNEEEAADAATKLKRVSKPRRNVRASRRSQIAVATDLSASLPTPEPSASPERTIPLSHPTSQIAIEPSQEEDISVEKSQDEAKAAVPTEARSPLSPKTEAAMNEQPVAATIMGKPTHPSPSQDRRPVLEKPMDIVIRARAKAAPMHQEPAEAKPRMVITYLVLTNFKSYAGRQEVGPFHASFSSVVGPNGSGKSNVIDSLLFVFGFRASKMRQGKISALIHNSAQHPDLDFCEVEVHFQEVMDLPGGKHDVMPDSKIVVSRKVFKNNSSKYYINGKESTFTVVTTLLKDRGIDLDHKRFLILQGEVESIAQMKPKAANEHDDGLLEYLEDIIGTSKYTTPIEESAAETETLNEVCIEKSNRVSHVEKERKGLEGKKDAALAYIKDENDLATKQSALYQIFVAECDDNIQVTAEAVEQMQGQLNEEATKHSSSEQEIKALQKEYSLELKQFEKLEQATQATLKLLAKADKDGVKFDERRKYLNAKMKKLEKSLSTSQAGISEASSYLGRLLDDIERNSREIATIETQLQREEHELATIRDNLKGKTQGLSYGISAKQELLEPWTQQINEQESAIALAQSELTMLRERGNAGAEAFQVAKSKLERYEADRVQKATELGDLESEKTTLSKEQRQWQTTLYKLTQVEPDKRAKLSAARQKADEARSSLSRTQTQGNVLGGLKRLRDSGRITGFHGRLGDLGTIDAKYDVAISTACPSLDNLVVDSVEVGQQCIEHLRKNNLGRANFILLDRLSQRDLSEIETPDRVPRLFDLVRSKDDKFLPAFYNVLQNTIVATDLEQANRIAYGAKRWRVVTLDGQLIDKSGTMSGGGTRVAKGAMSSKLVADTSKEQVAQLEAKTGELEQNLQDYQRERQDAESSIRKIDETMPELETKVRRCSLEMGSLDKNIADAHGRLKELGSTKHNDSADASRIENLESTVSAAEREIAKLTANASGIQEEIQALQDKIMEVGGIKLRGQKAKVDGLKDQMNALTEEMSNAEVNKSKTEKQKIKHEKTLKDAEKDLEGVSLETEKLDQEAQSHNVDTAGSKRQAEETQEVCHNLVNTDHIMLINIVKALDMKKDDLEAMKVSVDEKTAAINEARGIEMEVRNKLEEHQKVLLENQKRLKYWQEKFSKLALQNIR